MTGRRSPVGRPAYKVTGVPRDLVHLAALLGAPTLEELVRAFYLPAELTAAFIELGVARGVWTRSGTGQLHLAQPLPRSAAAPAAPAAGFARAVWTLMERRGELRRGEPILLVGPEPALETILASPSRTLWVRDEPGSTGSPTPSITRIAGDLRFIRGFSFGAFAQVIAPPRLGGPSAPLLHTVLANLAVHGAAYVGMSLADHERSAIVEALSRLETALILTDLLEDCGNLVFRGVKYPELRGNPEFLRYYVD